MMTFKNKGLLAMAQHASRVNVRRLAGLPTLADVHDSLLQAMENDGHVIAIIWYDDPGSAGYSLEAAQAPSGDPLWQFYSGVEARGRTLLWQHQSCDVLLIYNLILGSCGRVEEIVTAERAINNTERFRDDCKNANYVRFDCGKNGPVTGDHDKAVAMVASIKPASLQPKVLELASSDSVSNKVDCEKSGSLLKPKVVDKRLIESITASLKSETTALFNYPAFLYFLEQEYFRASRMKSRFSVVTFEMQMKPAQAAWPAECLQLVPLWQATARINDVKRHIDTLAHYECNDFALLLPDTDSDGAQALVTRIKEDLLSSPLAPGVDSSNLHFAFGIATLPGACENLSKLLAAADIARAQARNCPTRVAAYQKGGEAA
jgi:Diguanylate cyclase, GGDEF domain